MSILFIEPFSGISGDMFLGALCSLADDYETVMDLPRKLGLTDAKVEVNDVKKNGIFCKHVRILDLGADTNSTPNRGLSEIHEIIEEGGISENAKTISKEIFTIIGEAESKVHHVPMDKIHFHEVSGIDSILDVVGSAVMLDKLKVEKTYCDSICTGFGKVETRHGILPVPAPATALILEGIPCFRGEEEGEKVTPTGAGILKYLAPDFRNIVMKAKKTAYGPGSKDFKGPNVVRISIIEEVHSAGDKEQLFVVETNIDDTSAELLGSDFQENLLAKGAIDFYFSPVQMKKGRPGFMISVLVEKENLDIINEFLLEDSSTIGIRYYAVQREILSRRNFDMDTKYGSVNVKEIIKPSGIKYFKIEYESLRDLSKKCNMSIQQLQSELLYTINQQQNENE